MGSPFCDLLKRDALGLRYAFSCDLRKAEKDSCPTVSKRLTGHLRYRSTDSPVFVVRIIYDTGASSSIVPVNYVARLFNMTEEDTWQHLQRSEEFEHSTVSSLVASARREDAPPHRTDSETVGESGRVECYRVPFLLSLEGRDNRALLLQALVVNVQKPHILLSPGDADKAFVVLVDPGDNAPYLDLPTRIRFFEHGHSAQKSLDSWKVAENAYQQHAPKARVESHLKDKKRKS